MVLNGGLNKLIKEAEEELSTVKFVNSDSARKMDFLKSVIITLKAMVRYANRSADLVENMASKETDLLRKRELERIAKTCRQVPANPARNFREAMQSFWFVMLVLAPIMSTSFGRFDQMMYPFYKKDKEAGIMTDDETVELLECLRIKDIKLIITGRRTQRQKWDGFAKSHNLCGQGARSRNGKDAANELTYLILEAAKDCPTPRHTITLQSTKGRPILS